MHRATRNAPNATRDAQPYRLVERAELLEHIRDRPADHELHENVEDLSARPFGRNNGTKLATETDPFPVDANGP